MNKETIIVVRKKNHQTLMTKTNQQKKTTQFDGQSNIFM